MGTIALFAIGTAISLISGVGTSLYFQARGEEFSKKLQAEAQAKADQQFGISMLASEQQMKKIEEDRYASRTPYGLGANRINYSNKGSK